MKIRQGIFSGKGFFPIGFAGLFLAAIFSLTVTACGGDDTTPTADPALTGSVSISGITRVEEPLTAQTNTLEGTGTISYQWNRGDTATTVNNPIAGATVQIYTLTEADLGKHITVTVSRAGYTGTKTSNIAGPVVGAGEPDPTPTVTSVIVSPATARVAKGGTQRFSATVNGNYNPAQTVTWSVTGGITGTAISSEGLLTVAAAETATTLTVRAASTVNPAQSGTAAVTVTGGGGGGDNPAPPQPVSGATIYTLSGTTFTPYTGTGSPQTVTAELSFFDSSSYSNSLGSSIGTISADGKLTLNLPTTVEDSKLWDCASEYCTTDPVGIKMGRLQILSRSLKLYTSDGEEVREVRIEYYNRTGTITIEEHGETNSLSVTAGWNYFRQLTPVNNISDCKWVAMH